MAIGLAALCGCTTSPHQRQAVTVVETSLNDQEPVLMPSCFRLVHAMKVTWDNEQSQRMHEGWHRLTLYNSEMKEIAHTHYSCHYGMDVNAVDLDGDSIPEFVVSLHIGPATGPAIRELKVLRLRGSFLEELVSV
ncbi:MAG: hypothetical protein WCS01_13440, partial [bacterium]